MARIKTVLQKLEEVCAPQVARFIIYYYTDEKKRKKWDDFKTSHDLLKNRTYDECLEWLTREDAQRGMQAYQKHMKLYNMTMLYDSMLKNAMKGDVNAAKWVEQFSNSDYFDESADEIDGFLDGINIPALKK